MDDAGLTVDGRLCDIVQTLKHNFQVHEWCLYTTGAKLVLEKYFWTLVDWSWNKGDTTITPYNSKMDVDDRLKLVNNKEGLDVVLKIIGPNKLFRTLGVHINANGDYSHHYDIIEQQIKEWLVSIQSSTLSCHEIQIAHQQ